MLCIAIYNKDTKEIRYQESWPNQSDDERKNAIMQLQRLALETQLLRPETWELWGSEDGPFDWTKIGGS